MSPDDIIRWIDSGERANPRLVASEDLDAADIAINLCVLPETATTDDDQQESLGEMAETSLLVLDGDTELKIVVETQNDDDIVFLSKVQQDVAVQTTPEKNTHKELEMYIEGHAESEVEPPECKDCEDMNTCETSLSTSCHPNKKQESLQALTNKDIAIQTVDVSCPRSSKCSQTSPNRTECGTVGTKEFVDRSLSPINTCTDENIEQFMSHQFILSCPNCSSGQETVQDQNQHCAGCTLHPDFKLFNANVQRWLLCHERDVDIQRNFEYFRKNMSLSDMQQFAWFYGKGATSRWVAEHFNPTVSSTKLGTQVESPLQYCDKHMDEVLVHDLHVVLKGTSIYRELFAPASLDKFMPYAKEIARKSRKNISPEFRPFLYRVPVRLLKEEPYFKNFLQREYKHIQTYLNMLKGRLNTSANMRLSSWNVESSSASNTALSDEINETLIKDIESLQSIFNNSAIHNKQDKSGCSITETPASETETKTLGADHQSSNTTVCPQTDSAKKKSVISFPKPAISNGSVFKAINKNRQPDGGSNICNSRNALTKQPQPLIRPARLIYPAKQPITSSTKTHKLTEPCKEKCSPRVQQPSGTDTRFQSPRVTSSATAHTGVPFNPKTPTAKTGLSTIPTTKKSAVTVLPGWRNATIKKPCSSGQKQFLAKKTTTNVNNKPNAKSEKTFNPIAGATLKITDCNFEFNNPFKTKPKQNPNKPQAQTSKENKTVYKEKSCLGVTPKKGVKKETPIRKTKSSTDRTQIPVASGQVRCVASPKANVRLQDDVNTPPENNERVAQKTDSVTHESETTTKAELKAPPSPAKADGDTLPVNMKTKTNPRGISCKLKTVEESLPEIGSSHITVKGDHYQTVLMSQTGTKATIRSRVANEFMDKGLKHVKGKRGPAKATSKCQGNAGVKKSVPPSRKMPVPHTDQQDTKVKTGAVAIKFKTMKNQVAGRRDNKKTE